jgi:hypothetical protein
VALTAVSMALATPRTAKARASRLLPAAVPVLPTVPVLQVLTLLMSLPMLPALGPGLLSASAGAHRPSGRIVPAAGAFPARALTIRLGEARRPNRHDVPLCSAEPRNQTPHASRYRQCQSRQFQRRRHSLQP